MSDDGEMKAELSSILEVNALDYRLPPSLSVATSRQMKSYRSSNNRYRFGTQIDITLSSGSAYIDPKNSYLSFDLVLPITPGAYKNLNLPTNGGFGQLFEKYTILHSSGVELDRIADGAGLYHQTKAFFENDRRQRQTVGSQYFHQDGGKNLHSATTINTRIVDPLVTVGSEHPAYRSTDAVALKAANWLPGERIRVTIPMCEVAPIFNSNLLMPSFVAAGMRLELVTASLATFFASSASWSDDVSKQPTLENVAIFVETFQLTDAITRKLSQISASSGLEWGWTAVHQAGLTSPLNEISFQVSRALSRANNLFVKVRRQPSTIGYAVDSFTSLPWVSDRIRNDPTLYVDDLKINDGAIKSMQVQLGAEFIPAAPLTSQQDFYASAMKTFGAYRRTDTSVGPDANEFFGEILGKTAAVGGANPIPAHPIYGTCVAIGAVPLETSSTLGESGSAISAQRTLVVRLDMATDASEQAYQKKYDFFVEYTKLATVFLDSVVVRS